MLNVLHCPPSNDAQSDCAVATIAKRAVAGLIPRLATTTKGCRGLRKGDSIMTTENSNAQTIGVSMEGLTLRVADIERSLAFYKMIPGVEEIVHRPGEFALLSVGKGLVGLLKYGATHVEFGTSDVDGLYQHLQEVGFPVEAALLSHSWEDTSNLLTSLR